MHTRCKTVLVIVHVEWFKVLGIDGTMKERVSRMGVLP